KVSVCPQRQLASGPHRAMTRHLVGRIGSYGSFCENRTDALLRLRRTFARASRRPSVLHRTKPAPERGGAPRPGGAIGIPLARSAAGESRFASANFFVRARAVRGPARG